jgi:hypothetical protein
MNWKSVKDPMHFSAAKSEQGSFDVQRGSMTGYASGTDYVPETGPAIVGEKGPELVMGKDGSTRITGSGPHVENLMKGDSVLPADKTKKLKGYADGTDIFKVNKAHAKDSAFKKGDLNRYDSDPRPDLELGSTADLFYNGDEHTRKIRQLDYETNPESQGKSAFEAGYQGRGFSDMYDAKGNLGRSKKMSDASYTEVRERMARPEVETLKPSQSITGYAEGTANAENEIRKRGPNFPHVERSGSYMSRPRYFDSAEQMYVAMGDRPANSYTEKDDRESYEVMAAFQRGEKPAKPEGMTQKEYMNRIKDYGAQAMLKGNLSPEELQKATRQAEQPLWKSKAEDKTAAMVKSVEGVRGPSGEKIQVKPLIPPPPPPEAKPSSRDDWAKDAQSSGMDWELESLDKGRQPEMAGASGMGTTSGDLLKAYLTSGQ